MKKMTFSQFKLKLLEDKKLEDIVLKMSARPPLLNGEQVERILAPGEIDGVPPTIKDDRACLDVLETGLLFYMERVIRELSVVAKVRMGFIRPRMRRGSNSAARWSEENSGSSLRMRAHNLSLILCFQLSCKILLRKLSKQRGVKSYKRRKLSII